MPFTLFDSISAGLAQALTLHHRRHEVLASNIANLETRGYRARDVEFKDALRGAFETTGDANRLSGAEPRVIDKPSGAPRPDGNTVDVDMEMARLADNRGSYTTYANILRRRLGALRRAIDSTQ